MRKSGFVPVTSVVIPIRIVAPFSRPLSAYEFGMTITRGIVATYETGANWRLPDGIQFCFFLIERTLKKFPVVLYLAFGDVRSLGFQLLLQSGQHHVLN